jgi:hypothetical protein
VRTFIAVVFVISGFGIILSNADKLHKIAAMGLSKNLSTPENFLVILVSLVMAILFLFGLVSILHKYIHETNESGLHTALRICLSLVTAAVPPFFVYGYQKAFRVLFHRWRQTIEAAPHDDARKVVIKRILRLVGFASWVVSGALQFPAALF